jgi:hypothetical protein
MDDCVGPLRALLATPHSTALGHPVSTAQTLTPEAGILRTSNPTKIAINLGLHPILAQNELWDY